MNCQLVSLATQYVRRSKRATLHQMPTYSRVSKTAEFAINKIC